MSISKLLHLRQRQINGPIDEYLFQKKRPLIVMIGVTINIYGGTPVRSKFTKKVWKISYSLR